MDRLKKNRGMYACAFLLPFLIVSIICIKNQVYPFGENCILHIDMYHQYEPFFTELMDKLKNGGSLLYSFRIGLGSDFVSLFAYYLASPFNWLIVCIPKGYVIEFMTVLILIKTGLCGLTFVIYQKKHYGLVSYAGVIFAGFYALSGYMAAYYWNIMWLDCLVLAPLVVAGLERLVKKKDARLYCISLAISILSNFYISIMLCIFLVLYAMILLAEETENIRQKVQVFFRFALYSLLAGGMGAVLIFPEIAILSYSGSSGVSFPDTVEWYFDLISMLARHCNNVTVYTGQEHWPNLYCGAAVFLCLVLYLCNRKISWKKKLHRVLLIVFFWLSFSNNMLDFIWHGMHFPDSLPGREVYLYVFLLVTMAYEVYVLKEGNTRFHIVLGVIVTAAFLGVSAYVVDTGQVAVKSMLLTGVFTVFYGIFMIVQKSSDQERKLFASYMLGTLAILEIFMNYDTTGISTVSRTDYTKNWESVQTLLEQVDAMDAEPFYRVEENERLTKNDAAIYGYSSSTIFSSLMNIGVSRYYRSLGMEGGKNFYSYSGATPLTSAMLSVKYLISKSPYLESPLRTLVAQDGTNYIYKNAYTLPLGFMLDTDFEYRCALVQGMAVRNLNRFAKNLGATEDMLVPFDGIVDAGDEKTTVTTAEDGYLYATYTDTSVTNITVKNGERTQKFNKCDHGYILDLGWCQAGDVVEITNTNNVSEFKVEVYSLNMDALQTAYQTLNAQTYTVDTFEDTKITGHITVEKAGDLILSIPNEAGFRVSVDGKETECQTFMNSMIKIPLEEGTHEVTLQYMTPGLKMGAAVSISCLFLFILLCIWYQKREKEVL